MDTIATIDGILGALVVHSDLISFKVGNCVYCWPFTAWIKSEKSKKSCKVRLTFLEAGQKQSGDPSPSDVLAKAVLVIDFGDSRETLDTFCNLVSSHANAAKYAPTLSVLAPQAPTEDATAAGRGSPEPSTPATSLAPSTPTTETTNHSAASTPSAAAATHTSLLHKKVLEANPLLRDLYQQFVVEDGGVLEPREFWEHYKVHFVQGAKQPKAPDDRESFLAVPPKGTFCNGQMIYTCTPELAKTLLNEDAVIRNLYRSLVVDKKYPEESFWKRILQSQYFYTLIGQELPTNQILYQDIKGIAIKRPSHTSINASEVLQNVEMASEVVSTEDFDKAATAKKRCCPKANATMVIVDRLNRHSENVLKSSDEFAASSISGKGINMGQLEHKRRLKVLDNTLVDLGNVQGEASTKDELNQHCIIEALNLPGSATTTSSSAHKCNNVTKPTNSNVVNENAKIAFKMSTSNITPSQIRKWLDSMERIDPEELCKRTPMDDASSRRIFIINTKLCQSEKFLQTLPTEYDSKTVKSFQQVQTHLNQILGIYYKTTIPQQDKRDKLLAIVRNVRQQMESMIQGHVSAHAARALTTGLFDQINALENYDAKLKAMVEKLRRKSKPIVSN